MSVLSELPELLAEIAEVAGLEAALAIARFRGGARVHFPAKADDDHWLTVLVGRPATDKLCEHFKVNHKGGVTVLIPLGPVKFYDVAKMRAAAMIEEGHSISVTARTVGVTTRAIEQWNAARVRAARKEEARRAHTAAVRSSGDVQRVPDGPHVIYPPDLLVQIAEEAGMPVALAVAQARMNRMGVFPVYAPDEHWLVQAIGRRSADRVSELVERLYGAEVVLMVPRAQPFLSSIVYRRAAVMRDEGLTVDEVGRALGVAANTVERWWKAERAQTVKRRADATVRAMSHDEEG